MKLPPNPLVHEIGTWVWLRDLTTRLGRPVTLADVPASFVGWSNGRPGNGR